MELAGSRFSYFARRNRMGAASCKTINKRQLRLHHVKILMFTAGYARKEAQAHADMRLVLSSFKLKTNLANLWVHVFYLLFC